MHITPTHHAVAIMMIRQFRCTRNEEGKCLG